MGNFAHMGSYVGRIRIRVHFRSRKLKLVKSSLQQYHLWHPINWK